MVPASAAKVILRTAYSIPVGATCPIPWAVSATGVVVIATDVRVTIHTEGDGEETENKNAEEKFDARHNKINSEREFLIIINKVRQSIL